MPPPGSPDHDLTVGEYLSCVARSVWSDRRGRSVLLWPADIFAVAGSLLHKSGSYLTLVHDWPPKQHSHLDDWITYLSRIAEEWREAANNQNEAMLPNDVVNWWKDVCNAESVALRDMGQVPVLWKSLVQLCAASDEVYDDLLQPPNDYVMQEAQAQLYPTNQAGSTVCKRVHPSRLRVLPKIRLPRKGLSCRSLSQNLAFCDGHEILVRWNSITSSISSPAKSRLNILLVPLPYKIDPSQFRSVTAAIGQAHKMPREFEYFAFEINEVDPVQMGRWLEDVIRIASKEINREIDVVVLPEAALSENEYQEIQRRLANVNTVIVAGLGAEDSRPPWRTNSVLVSLPFGPHKARWDVRQAKQNRWMMEDRQLNQYAGLAAELNPNDHNWWEAISLPSRELNFFLVHGWFSFCVVICEDLSRSDLCGDLIRAVGPNMVIAILQDAAQVEQRWPGKYAAVLADDPGCSVLTVSSAGMVRLSHDSKSLRASLSVGLWKDPIKGSKTLEPPDDGDQAVILTLERASAEQFSADGRRNNSRSRFVPMLVDERWVSVPPPPR